MGQGRGSAKVGLVFGVAILCLMALAQPTLGAIFNVGGPGGWTYNVVGWPRGKSFRAGDVLAFNYGNGVHNVVAVNQVGYNKCSSPRGARALQSGKDRIRLRKGMNYFICSFPGHCQSGMKIAVNAA